MPKHSKKYTKYSERSRGEGAESFLQLKTQKTRLFDDIRTGKLNLAEFENLLREDKDAKFDIVSVEIQSTEYPTGVAWVSYTTHAKPLEKRISGDHPIIEANNTLLRCCSRLRAVDHVLGEKAKSQNPPSTPDYRAIQATLRPKLASITEFVLRTARNPDQSDSKKEAAFEKLEIELDEFLIEALSEANLLTGCKEQKDYEGLLFHYRSLASLLDPAKTLVEVYYDEAYEIFRRDTHYPITEKTESQKTVLAEMRGTASNVENYHTHESVAFQEANKAFAELAVKDDRRFTAQARKSILPSAKNAYLAKIEIIPMPKQDHEKLVDNFKGLLAIRQAIPHNTLWFVRTGSLAYVGKGEEAGRVREQANEIAQQFRLTAKKVMGEAGENLSAVHVTCLLTGTGNLENQKVVIDTLKSAVTPPTDPNAFMLSHVAVNALGSKLPFETSLSPLFAGKDIISFLDNAGTILQRTLVGRAFRFLAAAGVALEARTPTNARVLSVVMCQSGQDRTGKVSLLLMMRWLSQRYYAIKSISYKFDPSINGPNLNQIENHIQARSIMGGHTARIPDFSSAGAPGTKKDSDSSGALLPLSEQVLTLKSAKKNKSNPVSKQFKLGEYTLTSKDFERLKTNAFKFLQNDNYILNPKSLSGFNTDALRGVYYNDQKLSDVYQQKFPGKDVDQATQEEVDGLFDDLVANHIATLGTQELKDQFKESCRLFKKEEFSQTAASNSWLPVWEVLQTAFQNFFLEERGCLKATKGKYEARHVIYITQNNEIGLRGEFNVSELEFHYGHDQVSRCPFSCKIVTDWKPNAQGKLKLYSITFSGEDRKLARQCFTQGKIDFQKSGLASRLFISPTLLNAIHPNNFISLTLLAFGGFFIAANLWVVALPALLITSLVFTALSLISIVGYAALSVYKDYQLHKISCNKADKQQPFWVYLFGSDTKKGLLGRFFQWIQNHPGQSLMILITAALFITAVILSAGGLLGAFAFMQPVFSLMTQALSSGFGVIGLLSYVSQPVISIIAGIIFSVVPLNMFNGLHRIMSRGEESAEKTIASSVEDSPPTPSNVRAEGADCVENPKNPDIGFRPLWKDDPGKIAAQAYGRAAVDGGEPQEENSSSDSDSNDVDEAVDSKTASTSSPLNSPRLGSSSDED